MRGIHRWPVNSPHKGPVTQKMFPLDDVIMITLFVCECRCALEREDWCCIVWLALSPLDKLGLLTGWLRAPLMAVGLLHPFRSSAQMHDYHFTCINPFYFIWAFKFFLYLSQVTNKVVQSINQLLIDTVVKVARVKDLKLDIKFYWWLT